MTAEVWPHHRAECQPCRWEGPLHLSPLAAMDDADEHNRAHEVADAIWADALSRVMSTEGGDALH